MEQSALGAELTAVYDTAGGCGSFYAISISHPSFKGLSTMKQHRIVNGLLAEEIKGMHGLQVSILRLVEAFETESHVLLQLKTSAE